MSAHRAQDQDGVPELWRRLWDFEGDANWLRIEQYRDENHLVVRADLPGVDPEEDLEVTISDHTLHISAQRRPRTEPKHVHGYRSELRYGSFARDVPLPDGTNEDDVEASFHQGVLEVVLETTHAAKPAEVRVPISYT